MKKEPNMSENHVDYISDSEGELSKIDFSGNIEFHIFFIVKIMIE